MHIWMLLDMLKVREITPVKNNLDQPFKKEDVMIISNVAGEKENYTSD